MVLELIGITGGILKEVGSAASSSVYTMAQVDPLYLVVIFALFVVIVFKALEILRKTFFAAVAGALFPIFLDKIVGIPMALSLSTIAHFALFAVFLYLLYRGARFAYTALKWTYRIGRIVAKPFVWLAAGLKKFFVWLLRGTKAKEKTGKVIEVGEKVRTKTKAIKPRSLRISKGKSKESKKQKFKFKQKKRKAEAEVVPEELFEESE